jgi:NAD(P)-dependent dehydrogenase (short-subunit alcohol dehydrogenase family)
MTIFEGKGRTAVITGGNRGIGFAIARALAERGVAVGICGRNEATLKKAETTLASLTPESWGLRCDVRSEADQQAFFAEARRRWDRLDICVPNSGEATLASVTETKLEDWNRDIETNLTGTFLTIREALRWMKETQSGGTILPVVSQAGKVGFKLRAAYCSSKWGTMGLIECARIEAKEIGVRVTALCPASVATDFQGGNPMGTDWMLNADDVAEAALYALSVSPRVELPEILIRCWNKPAK